MLDGRTSLESDVRMSGVFPILATPFDAAERIDVEDLRREVEFVIEKGAHGVGIALASEVMKLSESERDLATRTVVDQARGRVPVVVNTGAPSTALTVEYSKRAEALGASASMITPVPGVSADAMWGHYRRVSEETGMPIFIQDVAGASVSPGLAGEMAREIEGVQYIKAENPPTPPSIESFVEEGREALTVFGGAGGAFFIEEMRRGSVGIMPHAALPDLFREVWDLFQAGKEADAVSRFNRMTPLLRVMTQGAGPSSLHLVKETLRLRGVFTSVNVRRPAAPPSAFTYRELRGAVEWLGLGEGG